MALCLLKTVATHMRSKFFSFSGSSGGGGVAPKNFRSQTCVCNLKLHTKIRFFCVKEEPTRCERKKNAHGSQKWLVDMKGYL